MRNKHGTRKLDTTSTRPICIMMPFCYWIQRHKLSNTGETRCNIVVHPPEILKCMVNTLVQIYTSTRFVGQGILHGTEDVAETR